MSGEVTDYETEHARLGPSGADGWFNCAVFPSMTELYGDDDSSSFAAEEGTGAHQLLEMCLETKTRPGGYKGHVLNETSAYPDGFPVDDEMIGPMEAAVDVIEGEFERMKADDPSTHLFTERRVDPGKLIGRQDCWGTADVTIVNAKEILVIDLKYGRGIFVSIKEKKQTILYLLGALAELSVEDMMGIETLTHAILQPRLPDSEGNIFRSESIQKWEMAGWVSMFAEKAALTDSTNMAATPGEEQCLWCDGKAHCKAYANDVITKAFGEPADGEHVFNEIVPAAEASAELEMLGMREPDELRPDQILAVLDNADYILGFIKAVRQSVTKELGDGTANTAIMARYKLVTGLGNASWIAPKDMEDKLKNMGLHVDDVRDTKVKSPTQVRKIAKAHKFTAAKLKNLEKFIERKPMAPKLVHVTDDREAVESKVTKMFGAPPSEPVT